MDESWDILTDEDRYNEDRLMDQRIKRWMDEWVNELKAKLIDVGLKG